jgi:DNA adenine methylase
MSTKNPPVLQPLIKWAGGKRRLLREIMELVPDKYSRYYEPFLGSAALFFSLDPVAATLSDTNDDLIQMYAQVRDHPGSVISLLRRMQNSEDEYYRIRTMRPRSDAGRAARFIYLCTLSFNGLYRLNLNGEFNVPYGYKTHIEPCDSIALEQVSERLKGKKLLAADFEKATRTATKGDLVYFDPPYTVAHGNNGFIKYNAKIFSWADQKRLAKLAARLKKDGCRVLVSNADHSSIRELYPNFNVKQIERNSVIAASSSFRGLVQECLFY